MKGKKFHHIHCIRRRKCREESPPCKISTVEVKWNEILRSKKNSQQFSPVKKLWKFVWIASPFSFHREVSNRLYSGKMRKIQGSHVRQSFSICQGLQLCWRLSLIPYSFRAMVINMDNGYHSHCGLHMNGLNRHHSSSSEVSRRNSLKKYIRKSDIFTG